MAELNRRNIHDVANAFHFNTVERILTLVMNSGLRETFRILWESPKDSVQGKQHFVLIDEDNLQYDFHLDSISTAHGLGCYE